MYLSLMKRIRFRWIIISALTAWIYNPSMAQESFKIFDKQQQREITLEQLSVRLLDAEIIFFGEEHNDSIAHHLQFELLKNLHAAHGQVALSMEMFSTADQLVLDEYLQGWITDRNLARDVTLWNNYKDYSPMVEYAKEHGLSVIAANAPTRYTNLVTRQSLDALDQLSPAAKALLPPLPVDTLTGRYYDKFMELLGGHVNMGSSNIYQSQNLWDATMAYSIVKHANTVSQSKILHLNGRFHSDEHQGTVAQLKKLAPNFRVLVISSFSDESFPEVIWNEFDYLGDFIIITDPDVPRSY